MTCWKVVVTLIIVFGLKGDGVLSQQCTKCGSDCCQSQETCELSIGGGTCFLTRDRISCSRSYYCYKPRTCCGVGTCCAEGSYCRSGLCIRKTTGSSFPWYYIVAAIGAVILSFIIVMVVRRVRARRKAEAGTARPVAGRTGIVRAPRVGEPIPQSNVSPRMPVYTSRPATDNHAFSTQMYTVASPEHHKGYRHEPMYGYSLVKY